MVGLGRHGKAKYITGTRLGTSHGLDWKGVLAERWSHSEGDLGEVQVRDTEVIVMLKGRLHVRRRGDGRLQHCNAVPGTVWLCPHGVREDMIHLYGDVQESIHLFLPTLPLGGSGNRCRSRHCPPALPGRLSRSPDRADCLGDPCRDDRSGAGRKDADGNPGRSARDSRGPELFQPDARLEIAAACTRRTRPPAPSARHRFHRSPSRRRPDDRCPGNRGLAQSVPFRPSFQGRDRDRAAPLPD